MFFPIPAAIAGSIFFLCLIGFRPGFTTFTFIMALAYALSGTIYSVLGLIIVRLGKLSVYMIFLMLGGMLIPFIYGIAFLGEVPTPARIVGMVLLIASLFVPFLRLTGKKAANAAKAGKQDLPDNNAPKGNLKLYIFLCVCVFILNGCVSTVSKVHQINEAALETNQFLMWINFFNLLLSASAFGIYKLSAHLRTKRINNAEALPEVSENMRGNSVVADTKKRKTEFLIALTLLATIALINCGGGILMMNGAKTLPASVQFPMVTGGTIVLTSFAGWIFYKEKINLALGIGLALTLIGTVLFLF